MPVLQKTQIGMTINGKTKIKCHTGFDVWRIPVSHNFNGWYLLETKKGNTGISIN